MDNTFHLFQLTPIRLAMGLFTAGFALAGSASAQEACGDITCDLGTTCVMGETPCPDILCPEDAPDCSSECESEPYSSCQAAACETDADCAGYMSCRSFPTRDCPDEKIDCEGLSDAECEAAWAEFEAQCVQGEQSLCDVTWRGECQAAADCGEGFECVPYECDCAAAPSEGEDPELEPDCGCPEDGGGYCLPIQQACETDAECPEFWTCAENYDRICRGDDDSCETESTSMICVPPEFPGNDILSIAELGAEEADVSAQSGAVEDSVDTATSDDGSDVRDESSPPKASADDSDTDDVAEELLDKSGSDKDTASPTDSDVVMGDSDDGDQASSDGGCSVVAPGTSTSASALLGLVGLALAGASRRRRR